MLGKGEGRVLQGVQEGREARPGGWRGRGSKRAPRGNDSECGSVNVQDASSRISCQLLN